MLKAMCAEKQRKRCLNLSVMKKKERGSTKFQAVEAVS